MIRLTDCHGDAVYIPVESIVSVRKDKQDPNHTFIITGNQFELVKESPEEVARKVLEWRLAMIDYHHDIPSVKTKAMAELAKLAGLEEPNHD